MRPFAAVLATALLAAPLAAQTAEPLTSANYGRIERAVDLRPGDLDFLRVDWKSTVFDGLVHAQRADRPIFLWFYFGDPRGGC